MKHKSAFMAACLAALLALTFCPAGEARAGDEVDPLKKKLDRITSVIQQHLSAIDAAMTKASKELAKTGLSGDEARAALLSLCAKWPTKSLECFTTDADGAIAAIVPDEYASYVGFDTKTIPEFREMQNTRRPCASEVFRMPKGEFAISYVWSVKTAKNEPMGTVCALADPISSIDLAITPALGADATNVWLVSTNGRMLYSRYHEDIGNDPVIIPSSAGASLPSLLKKIAAAPEGSGILKTPSVGHAGAKTQRCIWKSARMRDIERRVVVVGARTSD